MVTQRKIESFDQLVDAIGAGSLDPSEEGPVVVLLYLWDGQCVTGSYDHGTEKADITDKEIVITDTAALRVLVERLFNSRESFVTTTGSGDMICDLRWEISTLVPA